MDSIDDNLYLSHTAFSPETGTIITTAAANSAFPVSAFTRTPVIVSPSLSSSSPFSTSRRNSFSSSTFSTTTTSSPKPFASEIKSTAKEVKATVNEKAKDIKSTVNEKASELQSTANKTAEKVSSDISSTAEKVKSTLVDGLHSMESGLKSVEESASKELHHVGDVMKAHSPSNLMKHSSKECPVINPSGKSEETHTTTTFTSTSSKQLPIPSTSAPASKSSAPKNDNEILVSTGGSNNSEFSMAASKESEGARRFAALGNLGVRDATRSSGHWEENLLFGAPKPEDIHNDVKTESSPSKMDQVKSSMKDTKKDLNKKSNEFSDKMSETSEKFGHRMSEKGNEFSHRMSEKMDEMGHKASELSHEVSHESKSILNSLKDRVTSIPSTVSSALHPSGKPSGLGLSNSTTDHSIESSGLEHSNTAGATGSGFHFLKSREMKEDQLDDKTKDEFDNLPTKFNRQGKLEELKKKFHTSYEREQGLDAVRDDQRYSKHGNMASARKSDAGQTPSA